jgi:predicted nucleic acid-binding protein
VLSDEWEEEPKVLRATCNRWTDSLQRATLSLVVSDLPIVEMFRFVRKRAKVHVKRIGDAKEVNSEPAGSRMNEVESQL